MAGQDGVGALGRVPDGARRGSWLWLLVAVAGLGPGAILAAPPGEVAAWTAAVAANRCRDYQDFLARFPDGRVAALAHKRVAALCQPQSGSHPRNTAERCDESARKHCGHNDDQGQDHKSRYTPPRRAAVRQPSDSGPPGPYHVVTKSTESLSDAKTSSSNLRRLGYPSEVIKSITGYYAVTLGHYERSRATAVRDRAVAQGDAPPDSFVLPPVRYESTVFP